MYTIYDCNLYESPTTREATLKDMGYNIAQI